MKMHQPLRQGQAETGPDARRLPPVDKWHPTHCGPSDMRIARDGTVYLGIFKGIIAIADGPRPGG